MNEGAMGLFYLSKPFLAPDIIAHWGDDSGGDTIVYKVGIASQKNGGYIRCGFSCQELESS